jgi:hypothetical protein
MIENACLMLGHPVAGIVRTQMAAMAREKDGRVCVQQTSDLRVQHRQKVEGIGLIRQTKTIRDGQARRRLFPSSGTNLQANNSVHESAQDKEKLAGREDQRRIPRPSSPSR